MKIGIEAQRAQRERLAGMDVYIRELLAEFKKILTDDDRMVVFTRPGPSPLPVDGEKIRKCEVSIPGYAAWEQCALPFFVVNEKIDLLHFTENTVSLFSGKPFVLTLHDIIFTEQAGGSLYQRLGNLYRLFLLKGAIQRAARIITVSRYQKQYIESKYPEAKGKILAIYNGASKNIEEAITPGEVEAFKKREALPERYFLVWGNSAEKKNIPRTLRAFQMFAESAVGKGGKLVCVGFPEYVREELHRQKLSFEHFIVKDYATGGRVKRFYAGAEAFIYPSAQEGFGLPLVEAQTCGIPVLASNTTSIPEVGGSSVFYFDPFSVGSMAAAFAAYRTASREEMEKRISEGRKNAAEFTWEKAAKKTLAVYREVADSCCGGKRKK